MRADSRRTFAAVALALAVAGGGCEKANGPSSLMSGPSELIADAVGTTTVRVSWRGAVGDDVTGYEIERRADLQGEFAIVEASAPPNSGVRVAWFDTKVEPNRYYGYRVRAVSRFGSKSAVSNIAGTKTASLPGLLIRTSTVFPNPESADPDGYTAVIRAARDTQSVAVGITAERLVPIGRGTYSVALRGLSANCNLTNSVDSVKAATVTDEGTRTIAEVSFAVSCRDPRKASIVVAHQTIGDTIDADGLALTISGIILEAGTPADERVYFQSRKLEGGSGATRFDNLRLGDYDIRIADVDAPCVLDGTPNRTLRPRALAVDTVRFVLTCRKPVVVDTAGKPFVFRHRWSSTSARPGDKVSLVTSLDLRAQPTQQALAASATITFDNAVIRYDSARTTGAFDLTVVSKPAPNVFALAATSTDGQGKTGDVQIVRTWFTVVGASGSSVRTSTSVSEVLTPQLALLNSKVRVEEATLAISGTAAANQSPTAAITGSATITVGVSATFSGSQSRDADGTIVSYAWNFGDNSSGSGVTAAHTYGSVGSYVVRLTVTDDRGATATSEQPIVVTAASATNGTIAGTVTSAQGPIAGATVSVTGGATTTTSASGSYSIANVATGARTVSVSTLPAGCIAPATQTATVVAAVTTTVNFTVQCTTTAQAGTVTGRITQGSGGAGIGGVQVIVQPSGGVALAAVTTAADGTYSVRNVPVGTGASAGSGDISLTGLPANCSTPGSQRYELLTPGGTVTKDISVTCASASGGTVSGTVTKSTGGALSGVLVTLSPTGASALAGVTTSASGGYSVSGVAAGAGTIALSGLPTGCTAPSGLTYAGVTAGGIVTKDITVTCASSGAQTYPFSGVWGPITATGPTGRQVTLRFSIDMGAAPGRLDVDGANADPLSAVSFNVAYNGTRLDYISRLLLSPNGEFDLGAVNETSPGLATARANVALTSTSGGLLTGSNPLIRLTFNIAAGVTGAIPATVIVSEALATTSLINVTSSIVVVPIAVLTIP